MKTMYMLLMLVGLALETGAQTKPVTEKCHATTKTGTQCTRSAKTNGYCTQHNPQALRCGFITKAGTSCKAVVKSEGKRCHNHM